MPTTSISRLASDVAAILGESLALDCHPDESPFPNITQRVKILFPRALATLILEQPSAATELAVAFSGELTSLSSGLAELNLPNDYLQLINVKLSNWKREVSKIIPTESLEFARQLNKWEGTKASSTFPKAFLTFSPPGNLTLLLSPASPSSRIDYAFYVPYPSISKEDDVQIPSKLYSSLVTTLAEEIRETSYNA